MVLRSAICIMFLVTSACTRKVEDFSKIRIQSAQSVSGKVEAISSLPVGRKACYGFSVTGPNISASTNSCSPLLGLTGGFVEAGGILEASVPRGSQRTIDLYLLLLAVGDNSPCPSLINPFPSNLLDKIYFVGRTSNIDLTQAEQTVNITATFPGESQNIAVQNSYASSCLPANTIASNPRGFQISADTQTATSSGYILHGRAGVPTNGTILISPSYKIITK